VNFLKNYLPLTQICIIINNVTILKILIKSGGGNGPVKPQQPLQSDVCKRC